jgi:hypothetical protein
MTRKTERFNTPSLLALLGLVVGSSACIIRGSSAVVDEPDAATDVAKPDARAPDVSAPDVGESDVAQPDVTAPGDAPGDATPADAAPADAGCGSTWPTCDARPTTAMATTISSLWMADPMRPTFSWVSGVVVTAISRGGCAAGSACQIYVQEPTGATTLTDAARHAIKVFISAASSSRFTSIRVGDRVDVAAWAWRYTISGQNELLLQVADSCSLRGCMTRTGDGVIDPVPATLSALGSVAAYESTVGPVLVRFSDVAATTDPATPLESTTGGLFVPGVPLDGGRAEAISVSPFFMPGSRFVGYTASQRLRFTTLTGVFGMFIPSGASSDGGVAKYLQVYPRSTMDLVVM